MIPRSRSKRVLGVLLGLCFTLAASNFFLNFSSRRPTKTTARISLLEKDSIHTVTLQRHLAIADIDDCCDGLQITISPDTYWLKDLTIVGPNEAQVLLMGIYVPPDRNAQLNIVTKAMRHTISLRIQPPNVVLESGQSESNAAKFIALDAWTIAEHQGFWEHLAEKMTKPLKIVDEDHDGCIYAKLQWLFTAAPDNFKHFSEIADHFARSHLIGFQYLEWLLQIPFEDYLKEPSEHNLPPNFVPPHEPIPILGTSFVPEEIYWVSRLLGSIDHEVTVLAVHRDGSYPDTWWGRCWRKEEAAMLARHPNVRLTSSDVTHGCSRGWNRIASYMIGDSPHKYALIINADAAFRPATLRHVPSMIVTHQNLLALSNETAGVILFEWEFIPTSWSAFILPKKTYETVGSFDENFYPSFSEDDDYRRRLNNTGLLWSSKFVNGVRLVHGPLEAPTHVSGHKHREARQRMAETFPPRTANIYEMLYNSKHYYYLKWNGPDCLFKTPFNIPNASQSYWVKDEYRIAKMRAHEGSPKYNLSLLAGVDPNQSYLDCWACTPQCPTPTPGPSPAPSSPIVSIWNFFRRKLGWT